MDLAFSHKSLCIFHYKSNYNNSQPQFPLCKIGLNEPSKKENVSKHGT